MDWMLMPLRRYAEFSGRSRRKEYWMFALFVGLVYLAFFILMMVLGGSALLGAATGNGVATAATGGGLLIVGGLYTIFALAILVPGIAVAVRRLHDTERTGWWLLAPLGGYVVMLVGVAAGSSALTMIGSLLALGLAIALIVFYCLDGTPGPNRYGEDPKLRGMTDTASVGY